MKYEAPELTALTPAIDAIQSSKPFGSPQDSQPEHTEGPIGAYEDWE